MTTQCPICREKHEPERGLSYDGCGINSCGTYRDRLATFSDKRGLTSGLLGPMFAAAPVMLEALKAVPTHGCVCDGGIACLHCTIKNAIAKAEGGA